MTVLAGGTVVFVGLTVVPLTVLGLVVYRTLHIDYGALPAAQVYQRVFRRPVPQGVSDLKVAGQGFGQGHQVWMRFQATDQEINSLARRDEKISASEFCDWVPPALFQSPEARAVGLDQVLRLSKPEYFHFSSVENGVGWYGVLVVDRERHLVFANAVVL
jgi:hypothetical protein